MATTYELATAIVESMKQTMKDHGAHFSGHLEESEAVSKMFGLLGAWNVEHRQALDEIAHAILPVFTVPVHGVIVEVAVAEHLRNIARKALADKLSKAASEGRPLDEGHNG